MSGAVVAQTAATAVVSLSEVKAFLRVEHDAEDALLAGFIRSATDLCEAFTGQVLLVREIDVRVRADGNWHRLTPTPVTRLVSAAGHGADGSSAALAMTHVDMQVDFSGDGWVRCVAPDVAVARLTVEAGIAADWNGLPEALRQGIVRLVAHLYAHRDDAAADERTGPPAAVAALWRPWRRMRLS